MKEIKLTKLLIENFKCFQKLEIDFNNQDMMIKGANGSGKTTIMDALNWLLFKKNSHGDQDFSVKPLDKNGKSKQSVVISVYGEFLVDDQVITLKRTMEEQWTRKRGSKETTFTGNTYSYEINGVPATSEKAFKDVVAELCDEPLFRLITNPHYFNNLDKKEKRKILLNCLQSQFNDLEIVRSNADLQELESYLLTNTIEELQLIKKKEIKELTKNLNEYAPRIDELSKITSDGIEEEQLDLIEELDTQIVILKDKIKLLNSDNDEQNKLALINELNAELLQLKSELLVAEQNNPNKATTSKRIENFNEELINLNRKVQENKLNNVKIASEIEITNKTILDYTKAIEVIDNKLVELRIESKETAMSQFDESETICPCCNRQYEAHDVQKIKENFNINKAKKLEDIKSLGLNLKKELEEKQAYLELAKSNLLQLENKLQNNTMSYEQLENTIQRIKDELNKLQNTPILENEAVLGLKSAISKKEQQIINAKSNVQNNGEIRLQILELENALDEVQNQKFKIQEDIKNKKRILELYTLQERDSSLRVEAERVLALCDIFVTTKCKLIENEINLMFNYVKFKLFDVQINGGIAEVCYATVNGVPYDDVNSAGKINAGLDIIKTLQKENKIKSFIFIDNAESITDIMPMDNQMITLYVSKEDVNLYFENK